jgi:uncharacterized protein (DUF433 family)
MLACGSVPVACLMRALSGSPRDPIASLVISPERCREVAARGGSLCLRYHQVMAYERITTDPDVMGGLPRIRDLRIPVATVIAMLADGMSPEEIVLELPDLTLDDIHEALLYAAEAVRERELPLRHTA